MRFLCFSEGRKEIFFSLNRGGEGGGGERQRGPLVEGGSVSGRISICKQLQALS